MGRRLKRAGWMFVATLTVSAFVLGQLVYWQSTRPRGAVRIRVGPRPAWFLSTESERMSEADLVRLREYTLHMVEAPEVLEHVLAHSGVQDLPDFRPPVNAVEWLQDKLDARYVDSNLLEISVCDDDQQTAIMLAGLVGVAVHERISAEAKLSSDLQLAQWSRYVIELEDEYRRQTEMMAALKDALVDVSDADPVREWTSRELFRCRMSLRNAELDLEAARLSSTTGFNETAVATEIEERVATDPVAAALQAEELVLQSLIDQSATADAQTSPTRPAEAEQRLAAVEAARRKRGEQLQATLREQVEREFQSAALKHEQVLEHEVTKLRTLEQELSRDGVVEKPTRSVEQDLQELRASHLRAELQAARARLSRMRRVSDVAGDMGHFVINEPSRPFAVPRRSWLQVAVQHFRN